MYSDAASSVNENEFPAVDDRKWQSVREVFEKWADWPPAQVSHHGRVCCELAREWLIATDFSALNGGDVLTGPRWLCKRFKWGPSSYPIHWCEAVRRPRLDCGALAALAHEVFTLRGVRSYRAQFVQRFSKVATRQWLRGWRDDGASVEWIDGDLIYHEGCALSVGNGGVKVWDASAGWWADPGTNHGYGATVAIRVSADLDSGDLSWGNHRILPGEWLGLDPVSD
jgi:hypothetical protein